MAGYNYRAVRDGFAARLITKFGADMKLERRTTGAYDPATGSGSVAVTTVTVKAVVMGYSVNKVDGETIRRGDRRILISASGLAIAPEVGDRLIEAGTPLEIVHVDAFAPAGVATHFEVQARTA